MRFCLVTALNSILGEAAQWAQAQRLKKLTIVITGKLSLGGGVCDGSTSEELLGCVVQRVAHRVLVLAAAHDCGDWAPDNVKTGLEEEPKGDDEA